MNEPKKREELNDAVEDALGFNIRSVKTIIDLFARPRRVFESYAARDRATYTPAIRLFFGLVGVQVLISALWGGWERVITLQFEGMDTASLAQLDELLGDRAVFIGHYADAVSFLQPIVVALFTSLSVFVLGWLRPQLSWPSRLNIAMGVLTTGSAIGLLCMPFLGVPGLQGWMWIATPLVALTYFLTMARGARGVIADSFGGVLGKSLAYTLALMILVMLAGFVFSILSAGYAFWRVQQGG